MTNDTNTNAHTNDSAEHDALMKGIRYAICDPFSEDVTEKVSDGLYDFFATESMRLGCEDYYNAALASRGAADRFKELLEKRKFELLADPEAEAEAVPGADALTDSLARGLGMIADWAEALFVSVAIEAAREKGYAQGYTQQDPRGATPARLAESLCASFLWDGEDTDADGAPADSAGEVG